MYGHWGHEISVRERVMALLVELQFFRFWCNGTHTNALCGGCVAG